MSPTRCSPWGALRLLLAAAPALVSSFYLPGMAPKSYAPDDVVELHVNHLRPSQLEDGEPVRSVYSYDYYSPEFHFCQPQDGPRAVSESLGSIVFGDRIMTSPFQLQMLKDEACRAVCKDPTVTFPPVDAQVVNERIRMVYMHDWFADGLPAGTQAVDEMNRDLGITIPGFPLGVEENATPYINNHFELRLKYHRFAENQYRVVGFTVFAWSRADAKVENGYAHCGDENSPKLALSEQADTPVTWTYSVHWEESSVPFATRWDKYLQAVDSRIHWFFLVFSAVFVCLLVAMVSTVLVKTLRRDIARYNRLDEIALEDLGTNGIADDGVQEDSGWKLVHGDVFRQPMYPLPLSVFVGNGAQLFVMTGCTIAFALFGFLSPSNRGSLGTVIIIFYTLTGIVNGYVSARVYKLLHGEGWRRNFLYTPLCLPVFVFAVFFFLNLFLWARGASGAVPFGTMLALVLLWFVVSLPLSLAGSWLGFRAPAITPPVRTNQIPRQIPPVGGCLRPGPSVLLAGVLPFVSIWAELASIVSSLWSGRIYYMFGFLFLCYGLMVAMCAAVTVLIIYYLLCAENYHWQWRSFLCSGSTGFYVFLYAMFHWIRYMALSSWTGGVLYLGYSFLIGSLVFILTGTIGFLATLLFVFKIYGSIKVD